MTNRFRLSWSEPENRKFHAGLDRGVLYVQDGPGVAWNGLVSLQAGSAGGSPRPHYYDGVKYLNLTEPEEFQANLSALWSPQEFDECDGTLEIREGFYATQQVRKEFGLSYRTGISDALGNDEDYLIHLVYNALAIPSSTTHRTMGEETTPDVLSWGVTTRPVIFDGYRVGSHFVLNTSRAMNAIVQWLENQLYGTDGYLPRLPSLDEIIALDPTVYGQALYDIDRYDEY